MPADKPILLIVEDDLGLQKQLKWCFDEYEVIAATNRTEALAQLRRFEPPVVLQDLGLPPDAEGVTEGIATLREIAQSVAHHQGDRGHGQPRPRQRRESRRHSAPTTSTRSPWTPTSCGCW